MRLVQLFSIFFGIGFSVAFASPPQTPIIEKLADMKMPAKTKLAEMMNGSQVTKPENILTLDLENKPKTKERIKLELDSKFERLKVREKLGPGEGGGGHEFEVKFKEASLNLLERISNEEMTSAQQAALKFDPWAMYLKLSQPGEFYSLCAPESTLQLMKAEGKMARVYPEIKNAVFLDCSSEKKSKWEQALAFVKPEVSETFFLHELLRIFWTDSSADNDYSISLSYQNAKRLSPLYKKRIRAQAIYRLLYDKQTAQRCNFSIRSDNSGTFYELFRISLWTRQQGVDPREVDYHDISTEKNCDNYYSSESRLQNLKRLLILADEKDPQNFKAEDLKCIGKEKIDTLFKKLDHFYKQAKDLDCL